MARNLKSPKQRAQETLDLAERKRFTLLNKVDDAREDLERLETEYAVATRRWEHAAANPDLQDDDDNPLPFDEPTDELTDEGET